VSDHHDNPASATGDGILSGLRVLDLSRVLAGPYCGQLLADHGAAVIKVEGPAGDETRSWGPPFHPDGTSAYFYGLNRSKRKRRADHARR
jgi:crotonobetainyl-CoA:carnitine CoA-transferase CaiB-like acyl-CoA transferase